MGHNPDGLPPSPPDPYLIEDFSIFNSTFCNIALTCKRLLHPAQEYLLYAPIIGGSVFRLPSGLTYPRIFSLVRTLSSRPELRQHVKELRICFPSYERAYDQDESSRDVIEKWKPDLEDFSGVLKPVEDIIASIGISGCLPDMWTVRIHNCLVHVLIGLLISILPKLERLCISETRLHAEPLQTYKCSYNLFGIHSRALTSSVCSSLYKGLATQSLTYLKVVSNLPIILDGLDLFPNLHTLDISSSLALLPYHEILDAVEQYAAADKWGKSRTINCLRIDFRVTTVGPWNLTTRTCMFDIIRGFRDLKNLDLYAEASYSKNPFRSVRAFPHYQTNIQNYPDISTALDTDTEEQYWDERIYQARTRITDYQNLVDNLGHLRPQLEILRLPGGFWTLPGGLRKPVPKFEKFAKLHTLVVPQAAILCIKLDNMRFQDVEGDFELSPMVVLPPKLQHLKIFDADAGLLRSRWLRELFVEQEICNRWPDLRKLEILFGPTYSDFELGKALTQPLQETFGKWIVGVTFEVIVGRDDEVPSLCIN